MDLQRCLVFLYLSCITLSGIAQPDLTYFSCDQTRNYTQNSTFQNNLNTLLSSLSSSNHEYGFYNGSVGQNPDRASVVALCRGDVELEICRSCVNDAARKLVRSCPNQKDAFGFYEECMIRYSNESIIGSISRNHQVYMWNGANTTSPDQFNQDLRRLLDGLRNQAANNGGSFLKFAADNTTGPDFQTIYALVQCTPDLTAQHCTDCLTSAFGDMPNCPCKGKRGGRIVFPSCNFRYESYRFFNYTFIPAPPLPQPGGKDDNTIRTVIIVVIPVIAVVMFTICVCIVLRKRQKRRSENDIEVVDEVSDMDEISTVESLQYDFATIRTATNNFSDSNKLGQGGFGVVYQGKLPNGQEVAVKRLSRDSVQGDLELKNEVILVAKLQHRNLVRLLGFCLERRERLLVYEFVPNASLDNFLFDPVKRAYLNWETRYKIIVGISRGLLYLHEDSRLRIIHRDLKASNVLLDAAMNPKISDFGMARLFALDETEGNTSRIVGTYGYMAPEYAMHGQFSVKSDVFSFGVLVLEILSGQKNICFRNGESVQDLLSYAWTQRREGTASNLIDPMLTAKSGPVHEMMRCIHIGLLCVQENVADRPTMAAVAVMLSSSSMSLPVPSSPAFFMHSDISPEVSLLQEHSSRMSESQDEPSFSDFYPR
ncbi:PREDICTED: cysteine-rich receptor-like protein kinase 10 [Ipomoea nil]|uniref:cysteine-rich receptor-like protein kinase 10 n=1 Tax=Ipomoea nil TaxID=35883 RepID=UPI0009009DEE|nr:PREDICTED: cysteine-rich receptor-like protein kinase 10 [Ipomoea nil]